MFNNDSAIYDGLKHQARAICGLPRADGRHQFLVGTLSVREENEIHRLEFDEDRNALSCKQVFRHPKQVWDLSCCPNRSLFLTTALDREAKWSVSLYDTAAGGDEDNDEADDAGFRARQREGTELVPLQTLEGLEGQPCSLQWKPVNAEEDSTQVATLDARNIHVWDFDSDGTTPGLSPSPGCSKIQVVSDDEAQLGLQLTAGCWDPHFPQRFLVASHRAISAWDLRSKEQEQVLVDAHDEHISSLAFNPNKPYHFVSAGHDRKVCFWDLRKTQSPLLLLAGHSHWVSNVRYNPSHDQLVLTSGTDCTVKLWSTISVSSAPLGDLEELHNTSDGDKLIKSYDEHDDSVYGVAWSCSDAWIFASLSYDGRVVANHVPPAEKYKILL